MWNQKEFIKFGDGQPSHYEDQLKWNIELSGYSKNKMIADICQNRLTERFDVETGTYKNLVDDRKVEEAKKFAAEQLENIKLQHAMGIKERRKYKTPYFRITPKELLDHEQGTV